MQLQREYESLQQSATEQISAALREGAGAAQAAVDEARKGGDSALQEALQRESELEAAVERLRFEKQVLRLLWQSRLCLYVSSAAMLEDTGFEL